MTVSQPAAGRRSWFRRGGDDDGRRFPGRHVDAAIVSTLRGSHLHRVRPGGDVVGGDRREAERHAVHGDPQPGRLGDDPQRCLPRGRRHDRRNRGELHVMDSRGTRARHRAQRRPAPVVHELEDVFARGHR